MFANWMQNDEESKAAESGLTADEIREKRLSKLNTMEDKTLVEEHVNKKSCLENASTASETKEKEKRSFSNLSAMEKDDIRMHEMLKRVLRVTLNAEEAEEKLVYLQDMSGEELKLSDDNASEALFSRISIKSKWTSLEYLYDTFLLCEKELRFVSEQKSKVGSKELMNRMMECLPMIQESCVNYCSMIFQEEGIVFPEDAEVNMECLVRKLKSNEGISIPFLQRFADTLDNEQDLLRKVCYQIFGKLVSELHGLQDSIMVDFFTNVNALNSCCKVKSIGTHFANMDGFLLMPGAIATGRQVQLATALGIVLKFTSECNDPTISSMFTDITKKTKQEVDASIASMRVQLGILQNAATELVTSILKAGPSAKGEMLQWLRLTVQNNLERDKENPNRNIVSTSGMMANLSMVMLNLCKPFMAVNSKKRALIQYDYLKHSAYKSLCKKDETMLLPNQTINAGEQGKDDSNFITQCYFLTTRIVHLGPVAVMGEYKRLIQQLQHYQASMEQNARSKMMFDRLACLKMMIDTYLLNPTMLHELLKFALLSCHVVCQMVAPTINKLPLSLPPPSIVQDLPQYVVDDITSIFIFVARFQPEVLGGFNLDELLSFLVVFLASPEYMHSPHLRAKMSQVLYYIFLPVEETHNDQTTPSHTSSYALPTHPLASEYLAPALLELYGDVEHTGFYDKLEHRYNIACCLKYLWKLPQHRRTFVSISRNKEKFVKFVNGLMNHINGLVTDALTNLPEIKALQEERANMVAWMRMDESEREQRQSLLAEKERTVTSSLQLANETIHMMTFLTSEKQLQSSFLLPELVDRLASMLNSVLLKLAGPRGLELKVANPESYKFRPKVMLQEIMQTILHFHEYEAFQLVVAKNGFYDSKVYTKCLQIGRRIQLLPSASLDHLEKFSMVVLNMHNDQKAFDESVEVPDEFLDPLMCTLMQDPVDLPSGYTVDRATIQQHLLNDETDPFTRAPLHASNVVSNVKLKHEIEAWMQTHRNA